MPFAHNLSLSSLQHSCSQNICSLICIVLEIPYLLCCPVVQLNAVIVECSFSFRYLSCGNCCLWHRSTGLELSVQQRFKWVQLRCDQEPVRSMLHRHLLRCLVHAYRGVVPMPDNTVYKVMNTSFMFKM